MLSSLSRQSETVRYVMGVKGWTVDMRVSASYWELLHTDLKSGGLVCGVWSYCRKGLETWNKQVLFPTRGNTRIYSWLKRNFTLESGNVSFMLQTFLWLIESVSKELIFSSAWREGGKVGSGQKGFYGGPSWYQMKQYMIEWEWGGGETPLRWGGANKEQRFGLK